MRKSQFEIVETVNSGEFMATKSILEDLKEVLDSHEITDNKLRFQMAKAIADIRDSVCAGLA